MIIAHVTNKQTITCFQKNSHQYKLVDAVNYKNQNQQLSILTNMFKKNIKIDMIDFTQFVKVNIIDKNKQF